MKRGHPTKKQRNKDTKKQTHIAITRPRLGPEGRVGENQIMFMPTSSFHDLYERLENIHKILKHVS